MLPNFLSAESWERIEILSSSFLFLKKSAAEFFNEIDTVLSVLAFPVGFEVPEDLE